MTAPLVMGLAQWLLSSLFGGWVYQQTESLLQKDTFYSLTEKAVNGAIKDKSNLIIWNDINERQDIKIEDPLTFDSDDICTKFSGRDAEACHHFFRDLQEHYLRQLYELGEKDPVLKFLIRETSKLDDFEARIVQLEEMVPAFIKLFETLSGLKQEMDMIKQSTEAAYSKTETVNTLRITDAGNGQIEVSWQGETETSHSGLYPFSTPLTAEDQKELTWYLEEYLSFPYGAERERAQKVVDNMAQWGELLFNSVFPRGDNYPDPRLLYNRAREQGLRTCQLCITSNNPAFLNIPWELLRAPVPGRYLAPLLHGFYRNLEQDNLKVVPAPGRPFRILLVICRPYGEKDIPFQTVARPVLEALRPFRGQIELEVLRPPTFDELQKRLRENYGYYDVVHFDGHGTFSTSGSFMFSGGTGYLAFETEHGQEHIVSSEDLGQELAACNVPLFVLNACRSAQEGRENPYSAVATQLVATGAKGVVAMSYSVHKTAASKFMQQFYETLVGNATLGEAVAAGRRKLHSDPFRGSVVGPLEFKDWMVPCLYQQAEYTPIVKGAAVVGEANNLVYKQAIKTCEEGQYGFVGRDYNFLEIERALVNDKKPWVLISGIGGVGKTSLAFGFARWYAETGGCPGGVFVTSFKEKADLDFVLGSIAGFGTDFSRLLEEQQVNVIVKYLRDTPCLLIWDNIETVAGYPKGVEPLATDEEQKELSQFLKALKGGKTKVIITTRKPEEDWLGIGYTLIELTGLTKEDAGELAKSILSTKGRRPEDFKDNRAYSRLLDLLRGHPRSMEVVLPLLKDKPPQHIIEGLQHCIHKMGDVLDASLTYVFPSLSERTQKYLPFVGVFTSYVLENILGSFLEGNEYFSNRGEVLNKTEWNTVLTEAASAGLIRSLGSGVYELHPTFPLFLQQEFVSRYGAESLKELDLTFMRFYRRWSASFFEELQKRDQYAVLAVAIEEANLLRALHLAEINQQWITAQVIVQVLYEFYESSGRFGECSRLCRHTLDIVGYELPDNADQDMANLWIFALGAEANHAQQRNELETAESAYNRIIDYLKGTGDPSLEPKIAVGYHQLGTIAQERQQFDTAEEWYKKALEIFERLGLERDAATTYHNLGIIAQERQQFDSAEDWYKKALEIRKRLGLERDAANTYHNLGFIAQERQQLDSAEEWYKKALEIRKRLGLERDAANTYHQLGIIAQERQQLDSAEEWYKKALEIRKRLNHPPLLVNTLAQFGVLYRKQNRLSESVASFGKAFHIAAKYQMHIGYNILVDLGKNMEIMGEEDFVTVWHQTFKEDPPLDTIHDIMKKIKEDNP
jgi:tetratricopeptide (TPR) repeat protein